MKRKLARVSEHHSTQLSNIAFRSAMVKRTNGFQRPFNAMQAVTWILLPLLIIQFIVCISPVFPLSASVPTTILYLIFSGCSAYFGFKACATDPIDPRLTNEHCAENHQDDTHIEPDTKYCWVCETRVGIKSMHCKFCNKCVATFDHHCQWLNTCIGEKNYGYFYKAVVSTCLFVLTHTIMSVVTIGLYYGRVGKFKKRTDEIYGINKPAMIYIIISFAAVTLTSTLLVGQLWHFHITLKRQGLTTYAYIVKDNAKRRDKFKANMTIKRKRTLEINKAKREGRTWDTLRLRIGEKLRPCDPYCCITCDPLMIQDEAEENEQEMIENGQTENQPNDNSTTSSPTNNKPIFIPVSPRHKKPLGKPLQNEARSESSESLELRPNDHSMVRTDSHTEQEDINSNSEEENTHADDPILMTNAQHQLEDVSTECVDKSTLKGNDIESNSSTLTGQKTTAMTLVDTVTNADAKTVSSSNTNSTVLIPLDTESDQQKGI